METNSAWVLARLHNRVKCGSTCIVPTQNAIPFTVFGRPPFDPTLTFQTSHHARQGQMVKQRSIAASVVKHVVWDDDVARSVSWNHGLCRHASDDRAKNVAVKGFAGQHGIAALALHESWNLADISHLTGGNDDAVRPAKCKRLYDADQFDAARPRKSRRRVATSRGRSSGAKWPQFSTMCNSLPGMARLSL